MATLFSTKKRRVLCTLWQKLERVLSTPDVHGIVVAVSGGPDSRALLEALATFPKRQTYRFVIATVDHGIRSEALNEACFVVGRAKRLGFDAHRISLPNFLHHASEKDLRDARYRALKQLAIKHACNAICTAHHQDDTAEGFMMSLMGVGGGELGNAMKECEQREGFYFLRPFLTAWKNELLLSLSMQDILDTVNDPLDLARKGERAYVRHEILPELCHKTKGLKNRMVTFASSRRDESAFLSNLSESLVVWQNEQAFISLDPKSEPHMVINAVWTTIKKMSSGKDLRASYATLEQLKKDLYQNHKESKAFTAGLDPSSNGFNLKYLGRKEYQFPGVLVLKDSGALCMKRI